MKDSGEYETIVGVRAGQMQINEFTKTTTSNTQ